MGEGEDNRVTDKRSQEQKGSEVRIEQKRTEVDLFIQTVAGIQW